MTNDNRDHQETIRTEAEGGAREDISDKFHHTVTYRSKDYEHCSKCGAPTTKNAYGQHVHDPTRQRDIERAFRAGWAAREMRMEDDA